MTFDNFLYLEEAFARLIIYLPFGSALRKLRFLELGEFSADLQERYLTRFKILKARSSLHGASLFHRYVFYI